MWTGSVQRGHSACPLIVNAVGGGDGFKENLGACRRDHAG